jgi:hypothetical protein
MATTALDLITGALRRINSYSPGETLAAADSSDALTTLNELLDSWSTEHEACFGSTENILTFVGGQYVYTIGQAEGGTFTGTVTSGSPTITGVTVPSALRVGGLLTDSFGAIPANTYVLSIGVSSVTMTQNATLTPGAAEVVTYRVPGDFYKDAVTGAPVLRPLRITNAFTRITTSLSSLDYPISIITQDEYTRIGFKGIAAPWPIVVWYNPTMPLGTLSFYQNPSGTGQLHLFTDLLLTNLPSLTTAISLPQGYARWIKWALGKELAPEYGADWTATHERNWKEARDVVHSLNAVPAQVSQIDPALVNRSGNDAGWILHGGFGRR